MDQTSIRHTPVERAVAHVADCGHGLSGSVARSQQHVVEQTQELKVFLCDPVGVNVSRLQTQALVVVPHVTVGRVALLEVSADEAREVFASRTDRCRKIVQVATEDEPVEVLDVRLESVSKASSNT